MQESSSLKSKTTNGLFWSFIDMLVNQGLQFLVLIVLARILLPEHFGIIGMILVFIAISSTIIDSGLTQAIIREQNLTQGDCTTVFYFNLFLSFLIYIILYVLAPFISDFFGEPKLVLILRVVSFGIIISSIGIIQRSLLIKKADFKTYTKINIITGTLSGIVAILCAILGFGVWSLVFKTLSVHVLQTTLLWAYNKWLPSFVFSIQSLKKLFGFGYKLMLSRLIDNIYNNLYFLIIGKFYSATQLGYYTNAIKLRDIVTSSVTVAIDRVTYPILSGIQNEEQRLEQSFKKIIKATAFLIFPLMLGFAAIANPLVHLIFGEKWMSMVIIVQLLCLAGMLYPIHAINVNIIQVKGRSDLVLKLEIIKKVVLTILIFIAVFLQLGIIGLVGTAVLHSYIALLINAYYSGKEISYSLKQQLMDLVPIFFISLCMGGVVMLSELILPDIKTLKILLQIFIGCIFYLSASRLFKYEELSEVINLIMPLIKKGIVKQDGLEKGIKNGINL